MRLRVDFTFNDFAGTCNCERPDLLAQIIARALNLKGHLLLCSFDDARAADNAAYAAYYRAMLARGILLPPSQNEVMFLSTAHTAADVDQTLAALREALT